MKKILLFLAIVLLTTQNIFAWGWAKRDTERQPSEIPSYFLGDPVTFHWDINGEGWSASYKKAGIGTTNSSAGINWLDIVWVDDAGDGYGNNEGIRSTTATVNSTGTWYYSLWLGWGASVGDNGRWYTGFAEWNAGNEFFHSSYFTVSALSNPSSQTASRNSSNPQSKIDLSWSPDEQGHFVMIVRKKSTDSWEEPAQGTAYAVGASIGSGKVVYLGNGSSTTDINLSPATGYDYKFYSENYSYYSEGVTSTTVFTSPSIFTVGGGGSYCSGGSVNITLDDSEAGVTYELWKDDVATGTTLSGTGNALDFQNVTAAGTYTIKGTIDVITVTMTGSAIVTVNALPAAVTVEGAGTFCSTATITASNGDDGIIYFQGTTSGGTSTEFPSTSEDIIESGTYYFRAQSAEGCWGPAGSAVVAINTPVTPSVSIIESANYIVSGTSVTFTATPVNGGSTPSFEWHIGNDEFTVVTATTINANPADGDVVYVIMTSSLSCVSPASATSSEIIMHVTDAPVSSEWTGTTDNDWHTETNWIGGVPGGTTDVNIPFTGISNFPTISSSAACHNITLESGASILGNNYLNLTGTATVKRTISGGAWHLVSSPVSAAKASVFLHDYLQSWDETTATWTDIENENTTLNVLQGYSLWETTGGTSAFTGAMNSGPKSISITYTSTSTNYKGANLLGNPYPSAIDWTKVSGYGAVYYWDGNAYVAYPAGTPNGTGTYGTGSQYIPPMQGFFIVVPDNNPNTFNVTNEMRTHVGASNYYKSTNSLTDGLMLSATNGEYEDKLLIRQNEEASEGFDFERDAWKLPSSTPGLSQLWSVCADGNLSIDVHPATEVIQLGFANDQAGTYSIALDEMAGIGNAILEDTRENTFTDLSKGAYSFNWQPADNELRFRLHTGALAVAEKETTHTDIYSYQQTVYVNFNENINGDIYIYNLAGQLITAKESASGNVRIGLTSTGVYMVKVVTEKETLTQKVVIR